uniref:Probable phospholipid-transporting ATPase IH n=1 Tax=Petromyzon marinus TaxID=7757 RepID=A0AAJ7XHJ2_PETMA|nr:probable phospholipid-transporting ATPase IH [Petromyzon marinus]
MTMMTVIAVMTMTRPTLHTAQLALDTHHWTWLSHVAMWGSLGFYLVFSTLFGSALWPLLRHQDMVGVVRVALSAAPCCLATAVVATLVAVPDLFLHAHARSTRPSLTHALQMAERKKRKREPYGANGTARHSEALEMTYPL